MDVDRRITLAVECRQRARIAAANHAAAAAVFEAAMLEELERRDFSLGHALLLTAHIDALLGRRLATPPTPHLTSTPSPAPRTEDTP